MSIEKEILESCHVVAVVGLSSNVEKASNHVASYLKDKGYKIIPVNPTEKMVLDEVCYPNLTAIPEKVDVVDIFRRPDDVMPVVDEAIRIQAKAIWMQQGIVNEEAASKAKKAGIKVVMDKCMRVEHLRYYSE
jgi:uncharacterized protein